MLNGRKLKKFNNLLKLNQYMLNGRKYKNLINFKNYEYI